MGVVKIFEFSDLPDGSTYIIMELLRGEALSARLRSRGGRLLIADTIRTSRQIASALAAAHAIHNGLTTAPQSHPFFHGEKVAFGVLAQLVLEGKPRSLLNQVLEFASEVGLPMTLADIGLGELSSEMLERIAARTTATGETIHNEPFKVHPEMVVDSIRRPPMPNSADDFVPNNSESNSCANQFHTWLYVIIHYL